MPGLVGQATYENMSGGGGGKAIGYLIENAESQHGTLMVNSTPIVIRSLTGVFPQSFRDLTLVAGTIGDYAALVVHMPTARSSPWTSLVGAYHGGSANGTADRRRLRPRAAWTIWLLPWRCRRPARTRLDVELHPL